MNPIDEKYWKLLSKSLSNNITIAEEEVLTHWLASDPAHQQLLQELKEDWEAAGQYGEHFLPNRKQAWKAVSNELSLGKDKRLASVRPLFTWTRAAAAVILVALGSWIAWNSFQPTDWVHIASTTTIKEVRLPDRTKVWLSKNSSIRYQEDMNAEDLRKVTLEGEAFFEVSHNPEKPFIVEALETETTVLGTSFNVLARSTAKDIQVSVVTGKVQFRNMQGANQKLLLEPGTQGIYTKADAKLMKRQTGSQNFLFWRDQKLAYSNVTVTEALSDLGKNYGVQFRMLDASIGSKRITTSFHQESIEQIIAELSVLLDVEIIKTDNTYLIRPIQ